MLSAADRFWTVKEMEPPYREWPGLTEQEAYRQAGKLSSEVQVIPPRSAATENHGSGWIDPSF